jgi:hypothetical protein
MDQVSLVKNVIIHGQTDGFPEPCQNASPSQALQTTEERKKGRNKRSLPFFLSSVEILAFCNSHALPLAGLV